MEHKEVNLTYDSLFELLMREKNREDLQKLQESFFADILEYMKEKKAVLSMPVDKMDVFSSEEQDRTAKQVRELYGMLRQFYERREKKIISLAIVKSRTGTGLIDTSPMLPEEKQFYESVARVLDKYRSSILLSLLSGQTPVFRQAEPVNVVVEKPEPIAEAQAPIAEPKADKPSKMVRFVHAVPKFLGRELEIHGPFEEEDVASLPVEIADILIKKGRAEEMQSD